MNIVSIIPVQGSFDMLMQKNNPRHNPNKVLHCSSIILPIMAKLFNFSLKQNMLR